MRWQKCCADCTPLFGIRNQIRVTALFSLNTNASLVRINKTQTWNAKSANNEHNQDRRSVSFWSESDSWTNHSLTLESIQIFFYSLSVYSCLLAIDRLTPQYGLTKNCHWLSIWFDEAYHEHHEPLFLNKTIRTITIHYFNIGHSILGRLNNGQLFSQVTINISNFNFHGNTLPIDFHSIWK